MEKRQILILLFFAALLRILLITTSVRHSDMDLYYRLWGVQTNIYGLSHAYEPVAHYRGVEYPPLSPWLFFSMDKIGNSLKKVFGPFDAFYWLHKFFLLLIDLILAALLYLKIRDRKLGKVIATFFLFSPAFLTTSVVWGQMDNLFTLFLCLTLFATLDKKAAWAGMWFGLACLTKLQAPLFLPFFIGVWIIRKEGHSLVRFIGLSASTYLVVALPFLLAGDGMRLFHLYLSTSRYHPYLSANAWNLWWLLSGANGFQSDLPFILGSLNSRMVGWLLFFIVYGIIFWRMVRSSEDLDKTILGCALLAAAFFMLPTQMHERYLYPALILAMISITLMQKKEKWLWLVGSLGFFVNLIAALGLQYPHWAINALFQSHGISLAISAMNTVLFFGLGWLFMKRSNDRSLL
ncbi:MAG: hypothetical protein A2293_12095 [Elusimicrobia bacterium RIFOXYB2_FULL_49_7]|nr:MAG: hypothetical protein A2293_12095 [Elusimicrobia bacterium RIFOXYB2_FULL_49_7]